MTRTFSFPAGPFETAVVVPGDKSLGHRGLILAAMASGTSRVSGLSDGKDIASTRAVVGTLGVASEDDRITSPGIAGWRQPAAPLSCGNSGTTMRLMSGALAGSPITATLVGDASLHRRPMARLVAPLGALGGQVTVGPEGLPPVTVKGTTLIGADVHIPTASAQVRTAVALAALQATGSSHIDSPPGYRDHTERWLHHLGLGAYDSPTRFRIDPAPIAPIDVDIPADPSSAAFLWAAAAVRPGATVTTPLVSANPGRLGFLDVLEAMGATVERTAEPAVLGDPVVSVSVTGDTLHGTDISGELAVRSLDELPLVAAVANAAEGPTTVSDATELRVKESDRVATSADLARLSGASVIERPDGFQIIPGAAPPGFTIDAAGDHRIAMSALISAIAIGATVTVEGFEAAAVSWPGFDRVVEGLWS